MTWVAVAVAGGSIVGGLMSSSASKDAAGTQADAANRGTQAQLDMFNLTNQQQAPYREGGKYALNSLLYGQGLPTTSSGPSIQFGSPMLQAAYQDLLNDPVNRISTNPLAVADQFKKGWAADYTLSDPAAYEAPAGLNMGQFTHQFDANDLNTNLAPNYQFQLDQGLKATKNAGNLQTGLLSGNTLMGINDYAQNFAGGAYQNAFNNYNANQTNIFNRLSSIAGFGQTANQSTGNAAVATGQGIANTQGNAGAAQAAGIVGSANALSGGINGATSWYGLNSLLKPGGSGGYTPMTTPDNVGNFYPS